MESQNVNKKAGPAFFFLQVIDVLYIVISAMQSSRVLSQCPLHAYRHY